MSHISSPSTPPLNNPPSRDDRERPPFTQGNDDHIAPHDTQDVKQSNQNDAAAPPPPPPRHSAQPSHPLPDDVVFRKDPDKDDMGYKAVLESITNMQTLNFAHSAFRTVAFVSLPMFTLALHPNTMYRLGYPQLMMAATISTSTHQGMLGMQIGVHSWLWRGVVYMLVCGTLFDSWNLNRHEGAWYGMLAAGIFLASMVSHGMMRRFMYLFFFLYILEIRTMSAYYSVIPLNMAAWTAADFFLGSVWGMAALCFPFPVLVKTILDMIMSKIFAGFGKMFMAMVTFVWMPDAHAACLFFNDRSPFLQIEGILEKMAPLLWFANWEPTEFALRNPIRRLKLTLLRRVMALTYAAFGAGLATTTHRRQQSERVALHKIRTTLFHATYGRGAKAIEQAPGAQSSSPAAPPEATAAPQMDPDSVAALRENSEKCVKAFGLVLMQAMTLLGSAVNTPEQIVKTVPMDKLREAQTQMRRALRLEMLQVMKMHSDRVAQRLAERHRAKQASKHDDNADDNRKDAEEEVCVEDANSPYGRTHRYFIGREDAISLLHNNGIIDESEAFVRLSEIYFHGLMAMIAGEIISFGEQMAAYKPPQSLWRRLLDFFIVEPWKEFWEELWCILTLARPCDYRKLKDAIRMTCAYLSATALNVELYFVPGGVYYFGTTLLLGLPVEEESLGMSVNRMAGNALGCALGFMAYHNTHNFAQKIAMTLCFVFVLRLCKDHPLYGQTFLYSGAITMAAVVTTVNPLQLMSRLIASNYTVIAYMLCCMFIFPNNCIKVCWGYRCKLSKVMCDVVDDVAATLRVVPAAHVSSCQDREVVVQDREEAADDPLHEPVAYPHRNTEAMQMCSQLNIQMSLAGRLLDMCDKWAPFAARQHVIRGMLPFPLEASTMIQFSHKRMVAHLRMLVFGVQLLHRPRSTAPSEVTARLLSGTLSDFLAEFAGCMRLVGQDFIDSLQASRKWSYPLTLSHTSQVSWLRVRLAALHFECYVLAARHMTKSTFAMRPEDYKLLREEAAPPHPTAAQDMAEHSSPSDGHDDAQPNMSFVDRFLHARRMGDAVADDASDPAVLERLQSSVYLPQPREASLLSIGGARQKSFAFQVPLHESVVQPNDAFPFTQESAERGVQQRLREEAAAAIPRQSADAERRDAGQSAAVEVATGSVKPAADDGLSREAFEPLPPRQSKSKLSRLILVPDDGPELEIPLYRGPAFTYVEDELATEKDTDFSAIMTILCSCFSLVAELESLTGPMNTISTYQKELHESALAIGLIDKLSEKITAYRKGVYDRYHAQAPVQEQRRPLHAQLDPFADWRI